MDTTTRSISLSLALLLVAGIATAQEPYRTPPDDVVAIAGAPQTPVVSVSPDGAWMSITDRRVYPSIAQLAEPTLGLAGVRFNTVTNGDDQPPLGSGIKLMRLEDGREWTIDLPENVKLTYPFWSPDGKHVAFTNTIDDGVELWVASVDSRQATRLTGPELMAASGNACGWVAGSEAMICRLIPADRGAAPQRPRVPAGPTIQQAGGRRAPVRTYQNLLTNPFDEVLFDYYFTAQLAMIDLTGERHLLGEPAIFSEVDVSPDGNHLLVSRVQKPYSYLVPYYRFPQEVEVWGHGGEEVHKVASLPISDNVPIGGVAEGPRNIGWWPGDTHTLVWIEALDGGDPKAEVEHRDRVVRMSPPFDGEPREIAKTELRIRNLRWTERGSLALAYTYDRPTRLTQTVVVDAASPSLPPKVIWERSTEDVYGDPGSPLTHVNADGSRTLLQTSDGGSIFLDGNGASPAGDYPFLDRYNLATGESERLWQAEGDYYEFVVEMLDDEGKRILTRRESKSEPPNYFVRDLQSGSMTALTHMANPAPQLTGVMKERIHYTRADGVSLTGTLYLPPDYEEGTRLPTILWAYPRELKSAANASQVRGSEHRFTFYRGYSHLFLLTQGYAILDGASMPIIGEGDEEPNDSFVEQLVANAQAAVDALVDIGVTDRDRVGVGGHSYGAFMTANLLAHSDIFRAGIARSGAYNRSLTPFGFQNEQRTFWEAPEIYFAMSPFMHAEDINEPMLMLHGEADTNSGTFPIQSRRMFHALKGLGTTVKLVMYPDEQHGYRARETILDALYQQIDWFDTYVKNAPSREPAAAEAGGR